MSSAPLSLPLSLYIVIQIAIHQFLLVEGVIPSTEPTSVPTSSDPTGAPSGFPSASPSALDPPVLVGLDNDNFTYYCRPYHITTSAPNAFQRIEPQLQVLDSVGIVSATVNMSSYTDLDDMNMQDAKTNLYGIDAKYENGTLTLTTVDENYVRPDYWTYALSQVAYRFPDEYKPCSAYLSGYNPSFFTFQVTDKNGMKSNTFVKYMTLTTATAVISTQRTVVISRP